MTFTLAAYLRACDADGIPRLTHLSRRPQRATADVGCRLIRGVVLRKRWRPHLRHDRSGRCQSTHRRTLSGVPW